MPYLRWWVRSSALVLVLVVLGVGAGCARHSPDVPVVDAPRVTIRCGARAPTTEEAVAAAADRVLAAARAAEPATTALMMELAADAGGELVGLEHRLKTRSSTIGKIGRLMRKDPGKGPDEVVVYDALRYTVLVPDEPPGHHDESIREMLSLLEARGDRVVKVKNYWPRGDSYSGTNTRLAMRGGLQWEVQFHTSDSWRIKSRTHDDYERMRAPATPPDERRRLFEAMAALWERIPVPEGILEEGSLHPVETIIILPAP